MIPAEKLTFWAAANDTPGKKAGSPTLLKMSAPHIRLTGFSVMARQSGSSADTRDGASKAETPLQRKPQTPNLRSRGAGEKGPGLMTGLSPDIAAKPSTPFLSNAARPPRR